MRIGTLKLFRSGGTADKQAVEQGSAEHDEAAIADARDARKLHKAVHAALPARKSLGALSDAAAVGGTTVKRRKDRPEIHSRVLALTTKTLHLLDPLLDDEAERDALF